MNKLTKTLLIILLVCNLTVLGSIGILTYYQSEFIAMLDNKIDILAQHQEELIEELQEMVLTVMRTTLGLEEQTFKVEEEIKKIKKYQKILETKVKNKKSVDLENVKVIKEANVLIQNLTLQGQGSGTHIRINGEDYILTCGHLVSEKVTEDTIVVVSDRGTWSRVEVVKYNQEKDLALLKCPQIKNTAYLEISDIAPEEGSSVFVAGNPGGLTDMITDGIVTKIDDKGYYLITNKIYFGNSGGALIYKGKIVGVISQLYSFCNISGISIITQNYGRAVDLKEIKNFLKEPDYEPTKR